MPERTPTAYCKPYPANLPAAGRFTRQIQLITHWQTTPFSGDRQRHRQSTIVPFARLTAVLTRYAHRVLALLQESGAIFTAIKRATVNAFKKMSLKESIKSKRLLASWDNEFLKK